MEKGGEGGWREGKRDGKWGGSGGWVRRVKPDPPHLASWCMPKASAYTMPLVSKGTACSLKKKKMSKDVTASAALNITPLT